jgi:hypothetical protein
MWYPPENFADFFNPYFDYAFKVRHPVLYWLTVVAICIFVLVGMLIYIGVLIIIDPDWDNIFNVIVVFFGFASSFGIGIGICNVFLIVHKQYLGHYVTLYSFLIGIGGIALSSLVLWLT